MKILRGYVFRLYSNKEQETLINKTIGSSRFIYNYLLNDRINYYKETKKSKIMYDQNKMIPNLLEQYQFLKEVDSCALRTASFNLEDAYKNFFNKSGFPKYKTKGKKESYKTNNIKSTYKGKEYNSIEINLEEKTIKLPKIKNIKIRGYRNLKEIKGNIKSAVIKKESKKNYVSILVEEELVRPSFVPNKIVGIDLGIKDLIVTSNNEKIKNTIKINEKRIKGLQKALSRSQKGSKNRNKIIQKIQRMWQKIKNARKHLIYQITNKIIEENDIIAIEDLDIKKMYQNHRIAKQLTLNPLNELVRVLKYKTEWKNKRLIQIDRYYPSSQECNVCGYKNEQTKDLKIRNYECPKCHNELERDLNASINIMFKRIKQYMKII